jgi:hypothetical protein
VIKNAPDPGSGSATLFLAGILKVNDENSRIWIRFHESEAGMDPRIRIYIKISMIRIRN